MRIVSWNVNGLRAILKKNFYEAVAMLHPDILCLQEIKVDKSCIPLVDLPEYSVFCNPSVRKGYSGTAIISKIKPKSIGPFLPIEELIDPPEGRAILADFGTFYLVNVYVPNSSAELRRLPLRHDIWDVALLQSLMELQKEKPVILCGDMNVAHEEIDIAHPEDNHFSAGFTDEERQGMTNLLQNFGVDTFRKFYPNKEKCYSWWSYRARSRERNVGWRIDYVIVSKSIEDKVKTAYIFKEIEGSDHAPVGIDVEL